MTQAAHHAINRQLHTQLVNAQKEWQTLAGKLKNTPAELARMEEISDMLPRLQRELTAHTLAMPDRDPEEELAAWNERYDIKRVIPNGGLQIDLITPPPGESYRPNDISQLQELVQAHYNTYRIAKDRGIYYKKGKPTKFAYGEKTKMVKQFKDLYDSAQRQADHAKSVFAEGKRWESENKEIVRKNRDLIAATENKKFRRELTKTVVQQEKEIHRYQVRIRDTIPWNGLPIFIPYWHEVGDDPQDMTVLPKGVYAIMGTMRLRGNSNREFPFGTITKIYNPSDEKTGFGHELSDSTILADQLQKIVEAQLGSETMKVDLLETTIRATTAVERKDMGLRGSPLAHAALCNLPYKPNPNECMIDLIIFEAMRANVNPSSLNRQMLYEAFGGKEQVLEKGVSVNQLENYLRIRDDIGSYAIDEFDHVFSEFHCSNRQPKFYLVFKVNNQHVYPITEPKLKKQVAHSKRLELGDLRMTTDHTDTTEWIVKIDDPRDGPDNYDEYGSRYDDVFEDLDNPFDVVVSKPSPKKWVDLSKPPLGHTILVDEDDLGLMTLEFTRQTGYLVHNIKITSGSTQAAVVFEHPLTGQLIESAKNWRARKEVIDELRNTKKYLGFKWANQSWSEIGREIFKVNHGTFKPSDYPPEYMEIIANSGLKPLIHRTNAVSTPYQESIDTCRCYTHILQSYEGKYARFAPTDKVRKCLPTEPLKVGEYYISKPFTMMKGTYTFPPDWYPHEFIRICVSRGHFTRDIVTHCILATYSYDSAPIQAHAKWVHKTFPKQAKNIINHHIGWWGKTVKKATKQATTDSWETASYIINEDPAHIKLIQLGNLIHLRKHTEERLSDGYVPMWRMVVALSLINLDTMYNNLVGPETIVHGYHTDSIKLTYPIHYKLGRKPGDYRREGSCEVTGASERQEGWKPVELKRNMLDPTAAAEEACCYYYGIPGCGKTYEILRRFKKLTLEGQHPIVLCYTAAACENIHAGVEELKKTDPAYPDINCITFDKAYPYQNTMPENIARMKQYTDIIVDEVSMMEPKWFGILYKQLLKNPELCIVICGDMTQTTPVRTKDNPFNLVDYLHSPIVNKLCGGNYCELPYREGKFARYDLITKNKIDILRETGTIDFTGKKLHEWPNYSICFTPQTRERENTKAFRHHSVGHKIWKLVDDSQWYVGMPIIAFSTNYDRKESDAEIRNGTRWTLSKITKENCVISNDTISKVIDHYTLYTFFRCAWVESTRRMQGCKIEEKFNIILEPEATLNDIYTAIGRTINWDNIGVDPTKTKPKYELTTYTEDCFETIGDKTSIKKGYIIQEIRPEGIKIFKSRTQSGIILESWLCTNQQLDILETQCQQKVQKEGIVLANLKKEANIHKPKTSAVEMIKISRFEITYDICKHRYRIRYRKDGIVVDLEWGAIKNKEKAYQKALEAQKRLDEEYYGIGQRM